MQAHVDPQKIPFKVRAIASALRESGGRPLIVGGSVRDVLLEKTPSDWDIAVNLDPEEILGLFPGACTIGIEFGRVSVGDVDVVSLRAEKDYQDRRHPSQVTFGVSLEKDLERRDFTVNAMAWDPFTGEVFDPCGGLDDLERRMLACVGDPLLRFEEDPLRILRAVRLKNSLGFNLDAGVAKAIAGARGLLSQLPGDRMFTELKRILLSPSAYHGIMDMYGYGISTMVLPEMNRAPIQIAVAVSTCQPDLATRLAVLLGLKGLHDEDSEGVHGLKLRFNLPVSLVQDVEWLVCHCDPEGILDNRALPKGHWGLWKEPHGYANDPGYFARRIAYHWGIRQLERLIDVKRAIWLGLGNSGFPKGYLFLAAGLWALAQSDCQHFMDIAINGNEIMQLLDIEQGQVVGEAFEYLEDIVLQNPEKNRKQTLSQILLGWWGKRT